MTIEKANMIVNDLRDLGMGNEKKIQWHAIEMQWKSATTKTPAEDASHHQNNIKSKLYWESIKWKS